MSSAGLPSRPRRPLVFRDPAHREAVRRVLDEVRSGCDIAARKARDPVEFVHRYRDLADRELVALLAACLAFGNVTTIRAKLEDALARLGPSPSSAAEDRGGLLARLEGFVHRLFRGEDVAALLFGARALQRRHGILGEAFRLELGASNGDLQSALSRFAGALREAGGLPRGGPRRGPSHLLPDVASGAGGKRLLLFLRWMIRPADGVDLGLWAIPPGVLLCPVDTHIHKLARNLGLTTRSSAGWRTASEITEALRLFDPEDPVKYDFSLCHLGMATRCLERQHEVRCEGCGARPACRHWRRG